MTVLILRCEDDDEHYGKREAGPGVMHPETEAFVAAKGAIIGAAVGAVFLIAANEILRPLGQLSTFVVSAVALVVILFFPGGFMGRLLHAEGQE